MCNSKDKYVRERIVGKCVSKKMKKFKIKIKIKMVKQS